METNYILFFPLLLGLWFCQLRAGDVEPNTQKTVNMTIVETGMRNGRAGGAFAELLGKTAKLTLKYGQTSTENGQIIFTYERNGSTVTKELHIEAGSENASCRCRKYVANLPGIPIGERFQVALSTHECESVGHIWTASVTQGYGFCGTHDSTMELSGSI